MKSINTVVISRNLFERLCEAAIFADEYHRWQDELRGEIDDDCKWQKIRNEAVAIRDGANGQIS